MSPSRPRGAASLWQALRRARRRGGPSPRVVVAALPRMVRASLRGTYPGLSRSRLALMASAAAYVVSPIDVLPEGLLGPLGLVDDAAVLSWLAGTVITEVEAFLAWESGDGGSGDGGDRHPDGPDVVRGDVVD